MDLANRGRTHSAEGRNGGKLQVSCCGRQGTWARRASCSALVVPTDTARCVVLPSVMMPVQLLSAAGPWPQAVIDRADDIVRLSAMVLNHQVSL